jgi:competence protein ComEC
MITTPDSDAAVATVPSAGGADRLRRVSLALLDPLLAERARWALWLPVALGLGIAVYFALLSEPPLASGAAALGLSLVALWPARRHPALVAPAVGFVAVSLGFSAAQLAAWSSAAPVLDRRLGPVAVEGRVIEVDLLPEGRRLLVEPRRIGRLAESETPRRIRIRLRSGGEALTPGEWFKARAILMPPPPPAMPGAYDFQRQAYFDRLGAVGFAVGPAERLEPPPGEGPAGWRIWVARLRHAMTERIIAVLPGGTGGVAAALITGEMGPIPAELNQAYRDSGLAHLLSISGIHMSLVAGIAFVALRALFALIPPLVLRHPVKKWSAALAMVLVGAYTLLAGAPVPAQRSFFMIALVLLAVIVDRLQLSMRVVAWAAVVVMLWTPVGMMGPSFQMSFGAVIALIAFYETWNGRIAAWREGRGPIGHVLLYFFGIAATTVIATAATTPFAVYHFNRFALYALPANAVAVPLTGFWVMPWAMIACLLMPFGLERWGLVPMGWGVDAINGVAEMVAAWPGAVYLVPSMTELGLALVALGGLWLCIWRQRWRNWGVLPILAGLATAGLGRAPDIIVTGDAQLMAVRSADGDYLLSRDKGNRIAEETWTRRAGAERGATWPEHGASADGRLTCDAEGCIYRAAGQRVALIRRGEALIEDCGAVDLVISPVPVRRACPGAGIPVLDRFQLLRAGAHAIWLSPAGIRIESVDGGRGERPWVPRRPAPARARPSEREGL